jgi:O-antigen/teichoic acid export membrane protein
MIRGIFWNMIGMVAVALTMLITIPLFLRQFGAERYGILATIWVFFGYFSVLDFGMGPALVNFLSHPDRQDGRTASGVFWTAFIVNAAIGVAVSILLIVALLAAQALGAFAPGAIRDELFRAMPWLLLMLPVSLVYPVLVGALDARRLFRIANTNQVLGTVLAQALPLLAILIVKPTLTVAIAGTVLGRAFSAIGLLFVCVRKLKLTRPCFERSIVKTLMSFGGWVALSSGIGLILDTADRLVIAAMLGGASAAWYTISYNVVTRARVLPQAIARTLYPQVSADPAAGVKALTASARIMVLLLIPALTAGMVFIEPLCTLWIGADAAASVVPVARIMILGTYANCLAYIPLVLMQASGTPKRVAKIHLWETPIFLIVMYLATLHFGIIGAALAWSARLMADTIILLWMTRLRRILVLDVFLQPLMMLVGMAIAIFMPGGWVMQAAAVTLLLLGWAVTDTLVARRDAAGVSLLTIATWVRARVSDPRLRTAP